MSEPLSVQLVRRTDVADGTVDYQFALKQPASLAFRAGQFVTLSVGKDADGRDIRRSYSLASSPGATLRLILRLVPHGVGSQFFARLAVGDEVAMTGPHGFFVLDDQHPGDIVFAATGTGIAPVLPMMAELVSRPVTGRRDVYWGLRAQSDLFMVAEVEAACAAAGARLFTYLSRPTPGWSGLQGRVTAPVLEALPQLVAPTFYLVGNGAMIAELKKQLVDQGINRKKQIRTEAFFD